MNTDSMHMNGSRSPAPNKLAAQTRANVAAKELGIRLHRTEIMLGRTTEREWKDVPTAERDVYVGRAQVAIRLADDVKMRVALVAASEAVNVRMARTPIPTAANLAEIAVAAFISTLSRG